MLGAAERPTRGARGAREFGLQLAQNAADPIAREHRALLPTGIVSTLENHLNAVPAQHRRDLAASAGHVELPAALDRRVSGVSTD